MYSEYLQIDNKHLFIWLAIMFVLSMGAQTQREEIIDDRVVQRYSHFFAALIFLPIFLMSVWGPPRSDTYLYLESFQALPSNIYDGWEQAIISDHPGFIMLGVFIKTMFGANDTIYRLVIALIHSIPVITILRRYSDNYLFSIYLFVASSMHLAWMMNGLRQFIAVTLIFCSTPWIIEKKYIRVILVILFAASFHRTALFMIPVIIIVQGKIWNWKTLLFSVFVVIASYVFFKDINVFNDFANNVGYSIDWALSEGDDGAHPIRVLVTSVPMILSFLAKDKLIQENNRVINICVNMSVITTGIFLVAMVTSGIMVGRMPIYTSLYNLILLPHLIDTYFEESNAQVMKFITITFYFIYFYVQRGI